MSTVSDLIGALQSGDEELTQVTFDAVMASKVSSALDAKRIEVASQIYNNTTIGNADVDFQAADGEFGGSEE